VARGTGCAVLAMPQDFVFVAGDGRPYGPIGTNSADELGFTQLEDGEATAGTVRFAVPRRALHGGRVVVRNYDGERFGYWLPGDWPQAVSHE
jgi:hypothetical protein